MNSKWIRDLNVRDKTIKKILKENVRVNICGLGLGNTFLYMIPKVKKKRINCISSKFKPCVLQRHYESAKMAHRIGGNIYK